MGAQTKGGEKLLRRIGFRYAHRVDPFDGGPHFYAPTEEITLVQKTRRAPAAVSPDVRAKGLVAVEHDGPPFFRAVLGRFEHAPAGACLVAPDVAEHLGIREGQGVITLPLE